VQTRELHPFVAGEIDDHSLLGTVLGETTVAEAEQALALRGLTLGLEGAPDSRSVNDWIASGMPGVRDAWEDPVEQVIAGLAARMSSGERLLVRPAHATLRVHRKSEQRSRTLAFRGERNPGMDSLEQAAWQRIVQGVNRDG
jgi:hypothetical protein